MCAKGTVFKGTADILTEGSSFERTLKAYLGTGVQRLISTVKSAVLLKVERAVPLVSTGHFSGMTEGDMRAQWEQHWDQVAEAITARRSKDEFAVSCHQLVKRR